MRSPGSKRSKVGLAAVAEAVLRQALDDAIAGDRDAVEFFNSETFDMWVQILGYDPDKMRQAVNTILRQHGVEVADHGD